MDKGKVDQAFEEFKTRFPKNEQFDTFEEYCAEGTTFYEEELAYKSELSEKFQDFGNELLAGDKTDVFLFLFKKVKLASHGNQVQILPDF